MSFVSCIVMMSVLCTMFLCFDFVFGAVYVDLKYEDVFLFVSGWVLFCW